jgi:hypothetical protein
MHIYLDTMNIEVVDLEATPMFCLVMDLRVVTD